MTIYNVIIVNVFFPTLRNHKIRQGGGGNENGLKQWVYFSKTTTLHVRHTFWYILLLFFHDCDLKLLNSWFCFSEVDESFRIQLQKYSQPTDKFRLEKRELIFYATLFLTTDGETYASY